MIGLGIEATAHTLGVGIVKDGKIIANEKDSYTTQFGGIVPIQAAKHHEKVFDEVLKKALYKSKINLKDVNFISVANGPGLAPCLLVGLKRAKELAKLLEIPLVGVNHCVAHLEIGKITGAKNPVLLYVSGANTQIISYSSGKYRIFGETLDIGVGNFLDTFARYAGIGFPGGKKIEELAEKARKGDGLRKNLGSSYIELPYSIKGMDVAFSGILTNLKQKLESKKYKLEDLTFSLQETSFAMLVEASERALAHLNKKELLLGGGVACNKRLQEMARIMCEERGAEFFCPENELLQDNGAMIAFTGEIMFNSGIKETEIDKLDIKPRQRTDDVDASKFAGYE